MVAHTLRQASFIVVEAGHGQEALAQVGQHKIDLVITDLNMPVMDGIELIKQLRGRPECRFLPVLMLTTESQASRKADGKAAGATGWLVKPFNPDQLLQVVARVLP